jgi:gamma-glutamyltranspeptidase/glutathione hydrolase
MAMGDPDFVPGMDAYQQAMLNEETAKGIRQRIMDNQTHDVKYYDPAMVYAKDGFGTSHVVTADRSGLAASLTTTLNLLFGSLVMDPISGVILYVPPPK